jgi:hypothetical protein
MTTQYSGFGGAAGMLVAEVMVRFGTLSAASVATEQFGNAAEAGIAGRVPANMPTATAVDGKLQVDISRLRLFMAFPLLLGEIFCCRAPK